MKKEDLFKQNFGSIIQLADGTKLLIENKKVHEYNPHPACCGFPACCGHVTGRDCYFLKDDDCPCNKYGVHACFTQVEENDHFRNASEQGVNIIADERRRQVLQEGYSIQNDTQYKDDELVKAAISYLLCNIYGIKSGLWPWDDRFWKPVGSKNSVSNLKKAGALIAAEIDRIKEITRNEPDFVED